MAKKNNFGIIMRKATRRKFTPELKANEALKEKAPWQRCLEQNSLIVGERRVHRLMHLLPMPFI